eukprot:TRINITY_DN2928_c0_g1_i1.p1 TRINITY_DN2928_c0_g1~~TRINITY_DN2928_c0_g1_i1.p1  ORF type:complete len:132 (-),score=16.16 TRINITY_DN2928_c0_g1_i1:210-605(-)
MKFLVVLVVLAFLGGQTQASVPPEKDIAGCGKFGKRKGHKGQCRPKKPVCKNVSCLPDPPSCEEGFKHVWVFKQYKCVPICEPPKVPVNGKCVILQIPPCLNLKCPCSCVKGGSGKRDCFKCLRDKFHPAK